MSTKSRKQEAVQNLWDVYVGIMRKRNVDLPAVVTAAAERSRLTLEAIGARTDFDQLCEKGCAAVPLAFIIKFMRFSPNIEPIWSEIVGNAKKRKHTIKTLQKAANVISDVFAEPIKHDQEFSMAGTNIASPATAVASLHAYCQLLNLSELVKKKTKIRSSSELAKFLLSGYVEIATGKSCDRNISAIIGEVLGPTDYNEVAQRMWRHRNHKQLKQHLAWITDLLHASGVAIMHQNVTKSSST